MSEPAIEDYYVENRTFPPSDQFQANAIITDRSLYEEAEADRLGFWARQARELVTWFQDFETVLEWDLPFAKWFIEGKLNVSYNCLDRHVEAGGGDKVAFHWEGEPGDTRTITYSQLLEEVSKFANVLKSFGVAKGDRVCIYMPMIPELLVAMLACARIGAPHSIVFGGFSADSLSDRIDDASAKVLITSDGGYRRGDPFPLKDTADASVSATSTIENVVVVRRTGQDIDWDAEVDHWYHDLMETASPDCPQSNLIVKISFTSCTRRVQLRNQRGSCTRQVAISLKLPLPTNTSSTCNLTQISTGALPILVG